MKRKKKVLLAGLMAFTLMFSGLSGTSSLSVYAKDSTETGNEEQNKSEETSGRLNETEEKDVAAIADDTVAIIDGKEYSSLKEAVDSITGSGTVTLVSDVELSESITIPENVTVTLTSDENSHSITMAQEGFSIFVIEESGKLVIDSDKLTLKREKEGENVKTGLIACYGTLELNSGTLNLEDGIISEQGSYKGYSHAIVYVCGENAVFTMNGGVIKNAKLNGNTGGVRVCDGGKFYMNNGTITNIQNNDFQDYAGAVLVYSGGYFEMNGGVIEKNTGYRGGGVHVGSLDPFSKAQMVMNDGSIQDNSCVGTVTGSHYTVQGAGGGIYIQGNASVTMNNGKIINNTVNGGLGGGVATADGYDSNQGTIEQWEQYFPAEFIMNNGTISNNKVTMGSVGGDGGCGGGIYSASNTVVLKGGIIEDNEAERQGGGVYLGSTPYTLKIYDALITNNEASILGGGVWACPTGDTEVFVTNGVGIYDNTSEGAGDDVVSVKMAGKEYVLTLADRILGGGQVLWYKDGGVKDNENNLGNPDGSPRYNPDDTPISSIKNIKDPYALKAIVSDSAKELAQDNAKLFIRNNKSARGGGIGTNGGIVMGEKDNEYTLKVKKDWKDTDESLKQSVTVYLKIGDTVLDPVTLSKENNWQAEFNDLPDPDTLEEVSYAVVENPVPDNFTAEYKEAVIDKDSRTITVEITNTYHAPKLGGLTVEKEVTGTGGDKEKEFHFTVTLDDKTVNGEYGEMTFKDGVAEFTLKHGEKATAEGLPAGIGYTVVEKEANDDGYTTTAAEDKGTIPENDNAEVKFVNHKEGKPGEPDEPDKPSAPDEPKKPENPKTGDQTGLGFNASVFVMSGLFAAILAVLRKKK